MLVIFPIRKHVMKAISIMLLFCAAALGELPPSYLRQDFKPNSQMLSPFQSSFRPSKQTTQFNGIDVTIPSKLTIEQLIRLTEQLQSSSERIVNRPQRIEVHLAQNTYLPPSNRPQQNYPPLTQLRPPTAFQPEKFQAQDSYLPPSKENKQNQFRPLHISQSQNTFRPQNLYGAPPKAPEKVQVPQNQFRPDQNVNFPIQNQPQVTYGVPAGSTNNQLRPPSTSYGVPNNDNKNLETFGRQEEADNEPFKQNTLQQFPPYNKPAVNFRPQQAQGNAQYLPPLGNTNKGQRPQNEFFGSNGASGTNSFPTSGAGFVGNRPNNAGENVGSNGQTYLPPQTTPRVTTSRPLLGGGTPETVDGLDNSENSQPTTEASLSNDGSDEGPNISIANAVAGGGGFFYLQQPDGRLQKVVLQKIQEPNSKPEEYVANYYFQNIQALPNVVYTPLLTLADVNNVQK